MKLKNQRYGPGTKVSFNFYRAFSQRFIVQVTESLIRREFLYMKESVDMFETFLCSLDYIIYFKPKQFWNWHLTHVSADLAAYNDFLLKSNETFSKPLHVICFIDNVYNRNSLSMYWAHVSMFCEHDLQVEPFNNHSTNAFLCNPNETYSTVVALPWEISVRMNNSVLYWYYFQKQKVWPTSGIQKEQRSFMKAQYVLKTVSSSSIDH